MIVLDVHLPSASVDCPVEGRQCEMLDASACVSIEVKTRAEAVKLKKCRQTCQIAYSDTYNNYILIICDNFYKSM